MGQTGTFIKFPENDDFYQQTIALCKYHLGEDVKDSDFAPAVSRLSENYPFFFLLKWLASIQNTTLSEFDSWVTHARQTVEAAAKSCGFSFNGNDERELISIGLAVRTYPFNEGTEPLEKYCIPEVLSAFINLEINSPERAWAMEAISDLMIDRMTADKNRDLHLYLKLMRAKIDADSIMEKIKERDKA